MLFQEMPKSTDAALIRNHAPKTVKAQKGLETQAILQGFFHQGVA